MEDLWNYRDRDQLGWTATDTHANLSGFKVEALDGLDRIHRRGDARGWAQLRRR